MNYLVLTIVAIAGIALGMYLARRMGGTRGAECRVVWITALSCAIYEIVLCTCDE